MSRDGDKGLLLKMELPSDPALLCVVRGAVGKLAEVAGLPEKACREVTLAVDEALTNIIRHAYRNRRGHAIELRCRRCGGPRGIRLEFVLVDKGRAVDPAELRGRPLDEVRPGGLGTHLIQHSMDEVSYQRRGGRNRLRLVKYLAALGPAEPRKEG